MPTPVNTAKQCLNSEACHALDEAVSFTRRRGNPQTTSLHAVYAFLSLSPSQLKQACIRARNTAFYNPKIQLKALDFCLSVSLDRLPVSQPCLDEPHVSNSLMAAIKRSQANQRRHPDCVMAAKGNQGDLLGSISSTSSVKVDLQHLIVAILDDPIVSRVFNDAGFSSFDVKLAVLRPFQGLYRYPDPGFRRVRNPFIGSWDEEGEHRRVLELLRRKKGRNPLLVGVCANEVLKGFVEVLERRKNVLPMDICGINVVSIEEEVAKFATAKLSYDAIERRFKEVGLMVEQCLGPGLMVNVGNVRCFLGKDDERGEMDVVNCVVRKLTKLLEIHAGRVWVIGWAINDQTYKEFMSRFPLIEMDWDLQPLPITSIKSSMGEACFKSSLMRSFVPFGGFFSTPSDPKGPFNSSFHCDARCNVFDGKLGQGIPAISKEGAVASFADVGADSALNHLKVCIPDNSYKAKSGSMLLSGTLTDVQRQSEDTSGSDSSQSPAMKIKTLNSSEISIDPYVSLSMDVRKQLTSKSSEQAHLGSMTNDNFFTKLSRTPSSVNDSQAFPSSGVSVLTNLGLDSFSQFSTQKKDNTEVDDCCYLSKRSNNSSLHFADQAGNSFKALYKALFERVGRQSEALEIVSRIVAQSRISDQSHQRGDIWLNFTGPDMFGKRKTALALAEILYGSNKYFIHMNLCSQDIKFHQKKVFGYPIILDSDARSRGKTVVDQIAEDLRKTPFSVVLLENVQTADPVTQNSLLHAIRHGKFLDSHGREVSLANRVFVLTSRQVENCLTSNFSEARMEKAKGLPLQLVITHQNSLKIEPEKNLNHIFLCKRKLNTTYDTIQQKLLKGQSMSLDLNLPAEMTEEDETKVGSWLDELSNQGVNNTLSKVVFNPYDYDAMAEKILKLVHANFCKMTNSKCLLEIESRAMDQLIAAACLFEADKTIKDWIDQVLSKSFAEAQKRQHFAPHSLVMLATCDGEDLSTDDQVAGIYLPSKVSVT